MHIHPIDPRVRHVAFGWMDEWMDGWMEVCMILNFTH